MSGSNMVVGATHGNGTPQGCLALDHKMAHATGSKLGHTSGLFDLAVVAAQAAGPAHTHWGFQLLSFTEQG
jgi:hypothetical protein